MGCTFVQRPSGLRSACNPKFSSSDEFCWGIMEDDSPIFSRRICCASRYPLPISGKQDSTTQSIVYWNTLQARYIISLLILSNVRVSAFLAEIHVMASNKRSNAWNYFEQTAAVVRCRLCRVELVYGNSTGAMNHHLKAKHFTLLTSIGPWPLTISAVL